MQTPRRLEPLEKSCEIHNIKKWDWHRHRPAAGGRLWLANRTVGNTRSPKIKGRGVGPWEARRGCDMGETKRQLLSHQPAAKWAPMNAGPPTIPRQAGRHLPAAPWIFRPDKRQMSGKPEPRLQEQYPCTCRHPPAKEAWQGVGWGGVRESGTKERQEKKSENVIN